MSQVPTLSAETMFKHPFVIVSSQKCNTQDTFTVHRAQPQVQGPQCDMVTPVTIVMIVIQEIVCRHSGQHVFTPAQLVTVTAPTTAAPSLLSSCLPSFAFLLHLSMKTFYGGESKFQCMFKIVS